MLEQFEKLKREIGSLPSKKNIVCLLLYGSTTTSPENADDFDAILIVKKVDTSLNDLFDLLKSKYKKTRCKCIYPRRDRKRSFLLYS
jgi:hypothetical protein